jgi:hypothetical protein
VRAGRTTSNWIDIFSLEGAEDDDGLVVEVRGAGLEVGDGLEDGVDCGLRGGVVLGLEEFSETLVAEHLTRWR